MAWGVEWFVAITSFVIGISHILRAGDWVEAYRLLHRGGRPGAFANGALSLVPGAVIVAGHPLWNWPQGMLTAFGWLLVIKGLVCFVFPEQELKSMNAAPSVRAFVIGGCMLLAVSAWARYCLWWRGSHIS